jgi:hypothetical protein
VTSQTTLVTSSVFCASAEEPVWILESFDKTFQAQEEQEEEALLLAASKGYEKT